MNNCVRYLYKIFLVSEGELSQTFQTGRRSKLPVPRPDTGDVSLWNLLCKNIGKDLTKISMPVTLNEPLSSLQVSSFEKNVNIYRYTYFKIVAVFFGGG